ncbi:MAG: alpha/beta fold hydrolase [Gemmatimonadetes bacterium]|nr:alpha/beta fold hydrolase [Gemmatimonadota bacterium]
MPPRPWPARGRPRHRRRHAAEDAGAGRRHREPGAGGAGAEDDGGHTGERHPRRPRRPPRPARQHPGPPLLTRTPTLVVVGEQDQITPKDGAQAMTTAIPGARLAVVPGAGHLTPMERPEATAALLADFLTGLGLPQLALQLFPGPVRLYAWRGYPRVDPLTPSLHAPLPRPMQFGNGASLLSVRLPSPQ